MEKNQVKLSFCIWNFEHVSHLDISKILDLLPEKIYVRGEKLNPHNSDPNSPKIINNGWLLGSGLDEHAAFEDQMNSLLDILEPRVEILKPLCSKYYCEFSCGLFVYRDNGESTPSVHLNGRYNNFIKELNVEFDVDLYVF